MTLTKVKLDVKGYAAKSPKKPLAPFSYTLRDPRPNDVLIDIDYCGVCHSDVHAVKGDWSDGQFHMVPGHEIVGRVAEVGSKVSRFKPGDMAGVGYMVDSCRRCSHCRNGLEQYCKEGPIPVFNGTGHDGSPTYGGFSSRILVREEFVLRIPESLDPAAAAPLLCAGITTYSPLRHWKIGGGQKVGIIGIGGLGHMAVQFASSFGAHTVAITTSPGKEKAILKLGAREVIVSTHRKQMEAHAESFDFLINTIPEPLDLNQYLNLLALDGVLVQLAEPEGPLKEEALSLTDFRRSLAGSTIGGIAETQEMLDYCGENNIQAQIEVISIDEVNQAMERVINKDVHFRFVIDMKSLKENPA